ncbi:MAG: hypothetical protein ACKPB0_09205, partial [Opitutaceae bacterium]
MAEQLREGSTTDKQMDTDKPGSVQPRLLAADHVVDRTAGGDSEHPGLSPQISQMVQMGEETADFLPFSPAFLFKPPSWGKP